MDCGSECSALESVEENEVNLEKSPHDDENGSKNNGSFAKERDYEFGSHGNSNYNTSTPDQLENTVEAVGGEGTHLDGKVLAEDSSSASKGFGLKKWRRIRREIVKDPNASLESKLLKRGLSGIANLTKTEHLAHDIKQISGEDPVISSNTDKNAGLIDASTTQGSGSDFTYALGTAFAIGRDSENIGDRRIKSSSITSTPKFRHDMTSVSGHVQEKRRVKNMSAKNFASSTQRVQKGKKGSIEIINKPKGEQIKMEKGNSHSNTSLRSSNFEETKNVRHDKRSIVHDKYHIGEAQTDEKFNEEVQASYCNENEEHLQENFPANLSSYVKEEKSVNYQSSIAKDPLVESMCSLLSTQEALEEEIKKLGEIRNEALISYYNSIMSSSVIADITPLDPGLHDSYLSGQSDARETKLTYSSSLELQVLILTQNLNVLESKLNELQGTLALKDSMIHELETALGGHELAKEELESTVHLSAEESELEGFFRQKIEVEIEYLVTTKVMQNFKVAEALQHTILEELETSSKRQAQVLNKLGIAESKAAVLKNKAEKLGNYCGDILGAQETILMQKRLCKVALCFFTQFMSLIMVFCFFVSQLLHSSGVVIPT